MSASDDADDEIRERITMLSLDVRHVEGKVTRIESRLDRLEPRAERDRRKLDDLSGKVDRILRHFGIVEK